MTILQGTTDCGSAASPAQPPLTGQVEDASGTTLTQLGLGCLYTGSFPGVSIPDGATAMLDVTGTSVTTVTLGGSAGSGPKDCTRAAGPGHHCLDGSTGTDGGGACTSDNDCEISQATGSCALDRNCYFGPPIPVPNGALSACVVNSFLADLCGSLDLSTQNATFATSLLATVYLTGDGDSPCPLCLSGTCTSGRNAGQPCVGVGSKNTSLDCPPDDGTFAGALTVTVPSLGTGSSTLTAGDGLFCPGQTIPGAIGFATATSVTETGTALGASGSLTSMTLAGTFCVPSSGNFILDAFAQLPGVGGFSATGSVDLSQVLPLLPPLP